jgi:hypothetical protein
VGGGGGQWDSQPQPDTACLPKGSTCQLCVACLLHESYRRILDLRHVSGYQNIEKLHVIIIKRSFLFVC